MASIGVSLLALGNEQWWGRLLVPVVPLLVFSALLWVGVARSWPRPIGDASELAVHLCRRLLA